MFKKNTILILSSIALLFGFGCSSKKISLDRFRVDIMEVNKKVAFLNRELLSNKIAPITCRLQKENILKLQKENGFAIDKVLKLTNLLNYAEFSVETRKKLENSLDNALSNLFVLRKKYNQKLLVLQSLSIASDREYLCSLDVKPIPKIEACPNCVAVFN